MSIYKGTPVEQFYAHGRDEGYSQGESDLESGLSVTTLRINDLRERSETTSSRNIRAFALGYLRGYREAVRTLSNGRWGT